MTNEKRLNLNCNIKVKFTDTGRDIYYHRFDHLSAIMAAKGLKTLTPSYPKVDEKGYSTMQLWCFIELYGPHIGMCRPNVIEDNNIYLEEGDLVPVEVEP